MTIGDLQLVSRIWPVKGYQLLTLNDGCTDGGEGGNAIIRST